MLGVGRSLGTLTLSIVLPFATLACEPPPDGETWEGELEQVPQAITVPAKGSATTLDVASWNIEWFGDTGNGPTNEALQLQNARDIISGADIDIWGVAEIVSLSQWNNLEAQLTGYTGFLANESNVVNGAAYYSGFNDTEQKVGILYKSSLATVVDARVILTGNDYDFGGRPPLQVTLRVTLNGTTQDVVVIVLHAKCCTDSTSYQRRVNASNALKSHLDVNHPTSRVIVIGDFNDDVDTSISTGRQSPYKNFVDDALDYRFPTKALSDAGIASTVGYPDTIDHHLISNELDATYIATSAEVYRVDQFVPNYGSSTSDHFPVLTRYEFGNGTPSVTLGQPNGGESFAGGSSQTITWSATNVANVKLEYTLDNGGSWSVITASTPANAGSYAWTVPNSSSSAARVRVSDVASAAFDSSDGLFTITATAGAARVVLNEIRANEPGSSTAGEFVELVNVGGSPASIGGWTLSDATSVRHTFPAGATLAAGKAVVIFAGASAIPAGLSNAAAASSGGLSLANGGDTVTVKDASGVVKDTFTYGSSLAAVDGVSMNRSPDGSATGAFVLHTSLSSAQSSAGTRATGASW